MTPADRADAARVLAVVVALAVALATRRSAAADPLRLRADALATTASPAGLLVLEADTAARAGLSAEAVVWLGGARTPGEDAAGDVLVIALRARSRSGRAGAQLGRFVSALGALQPVHLDGASARLRLPRRIDVEAVAGVPVRPGLGAARAWDWHAGARLARRLGDAGSAGVAYAQRREAGRLVSEELGVDAGLALGPRLDAGARAAYDLAHTGLAEIALTASYRRRRGLRVEAYAIERTAAHLLPATSLFSVLGDAPSRRGGAVVTWRAAPRLELTADAGARVADGDAGPDIAVRARLSLDERGAGALTGELRRGGLGADAWTGARGAARLPLPRALALAAELELVIPDTDRGRGAVWPWALVALRWERGAWQAAIALEASATTEDRRRADVLAQLARRWGRR